MFSVTCRCGYDISVRSSAAGTDVRCPRCNEPCSIPSLRVLKAHAELRQSAPSGMQSKETPAANVDPVSPEPERVFSHFWGEVGTNGRVSSSAMENYTSLVMISLDTFLAELDSTSGFELQLSCALMPQDQRIIQIDTIPSQAAGDWAERLQARIASIAAPDVMDGPVAFVLSHRVHVDRSDAQGMTPFNRYRQQIKKLGFDRALMQAAGLTSASTSKAIWWKHTWRWLCVLLTGRPLDPEPTPQQVHDGQKAWLDYSEAKLAAVPADELKRRIQREPRELAYHVGLAASYNQTSEHEAAVGVYSELISQSPDCSLFYERRGRSYLVAGNYRSALTDLDKAIELTPFEPWYFYFRSLVFAGLDAWARAITDLDAAIQLAGREPAFLLRRAELHLQMDDHKQAIDDLTEVLRLDPNSGAAHAMLGWIHQQQPLHDLNLAVRHLNAAVELMPGDLSSLFSRSLAHAAENKFELALEDCNAILQIQPDAGPAHGVRGRMLQMQGEFTEAIEACTRAIELGSETPMVFIARGISYSATDQPDLALADCNAALELDPQNALALHLRGTLNIQRGELESAMEAFSQAKQIAPDWAEPREQIALLHRINENPQAAIDEQDILVSQQPKNPSHYVNRAFAHTQAGNYEAAESDYLRACELDPENEHIFFLRGCFFIDRQEAQRALQDFNRVLELAPDYDHARWRRASILLQLKQQDDALRDFEKLIEKYPDQPHAYSGRAFANQLKGDEQAAEADLHRLAELAPESVQESTLQALHAKVNRLESSERYDEALEAAEEGIMLAPDDPLGYRLRAGLRWYTEQFVEAADDYTRLLEMQPDDPSIRCSRGQVYAEMGEWEAAIEDLNAAVEQSRKLGLHRLLAFALNGRALALAGMNRLDQSTQDYEESIQICETNAWAYYHRGIIMYQRGDNPQAKQLLELALNSNGPALTKRKRERAKFVLSRLAVNSC